MHLGMSIEDVRELTAIPVENRWVTQFDAAQVSILANRVSSVAIFNFPHSECTWTINSAPFPKSVDDLYRILGEPSEVISAGSRSGNRLPAQNMAVYWFDRHGVPSTTLDDTVFFVEALYTDDQNVIAVAVSDFPTFYGESVYPSDVLGINMLHASGSHSSTTLETTPIDLYLDIDYPNEGLFRVVQDENVLFSHHGTYRGRIAIGGLSKGAIEIFAEGGCEVIGRSILDPTRNAVSSGTGDYVYPYAGRLNGEYMVSFEGGGSLSVRVVPSQSLSNNPDFISEEKVIFFTDRPYSGIVSIDEEGFLLGKVVIVSDCSWVFERVFSFEVITVSEYIVRGEIAGYSWLKYYYIHDFPFDKSITNP
jgi:hypothetical protein